MDTDTYELIIAVIGLVFTIMMTVALYIVNQARKDANNSVPPEVARTLADALPPSLIPLIIAALKGAAVLADGTPTQADNELIADILKQVQPAELVEDAQG